MLAIMHLSVMIYYGLFCFFITVGNYPKTKTKLGIPSNTIIYQVIISACNRFTLFPHPIVVVIYVELSCGKGPACFERIVGQS